LFHPEISPGTENGGKADDTVYYLSKLHRYFMYFRHPIKYRGAMSTFGASSEKVTSI
jgi:hypothetical protein